MVQLVLVYLVYNFKKNVVPNYQDYFLMAFFAFFYFANYYINLGLCAMLDTYYPKVTFAQLLFLAIFHTIFFGVIQALALRFSREIP